MTFIDNNDVEGLDRHLWVVSDLNRLCRLELVEGLLFELLGQFGLSAEHRVQALDSCDAHPCSRVDGVGSQELDVVKLGQLAAVVWGDELLEGGQRLPP